jgi:hypothetical protein
MQLHMHSLKSLIGKIVLSAVALSGFLVFAGAPAAQAQEFAPRPVVRYEHRGYYYGWHPYYWHREFVRHGWRDRYGYWHR